jgi:hypothetical protein
MAAPMQSRTEKSRKKGRSRDGLFAPQWQLKYGSRPRPRAPFNFARRRINEIEKLIKHRHGGVVPDTDDADRYVWLVAHHMGQISRETVEDELTRWCERWAPDFPEAEIVRIGREAARNPYLFKPDTVAEKLVVKMAERQALGLTTIGAVDCSAEHRAAKRAEKKRGRERQRAHQRRRAQGKPSRAEYETASLSETKPWERQGISRSTWYRRAQQLAQEQRQQREHTESVGPAKPIEQPSASTPPYEDPSHPKTEAEWHALSTRRRRPLGKAA